MNYARPQYLNESLVILQYQFQLYLFILSIHQSILISTNPLLHHIPPAWEPTIFLPSQPFSVHLSNQAKQPPPTFPACLPSFFFLPSFN